jgi:hypothetical protein
MLMLCISVLSVLVRSGPGASCQELGSDTGRARCGTGRRGTRGTVSHTSHASPTRRTALPEAEPRRPGSTYRQRFPIHKSETVPQSSPTDRQVARQLSTDRVRQSPTEGRQSLTEARPVPRLSGPMSQALSDRHATDRQTDSAPCSPQA